MRNNPSTLASRVRNPATRHIADVLWGAALASDPHWEPILNARRYRPAAMHAKAPVDV